MAEEEFTLSTIIKVFDYFDKDKKGSISYGEFQETLTKEIADNEDKWLFAKELCREINKKLDKYNKNFFQMA